MKPSFDSIDLDPKLQLIVQATCELSQQCLRAGSAAHRPSGPGRCFRQAVAKRSAGRISPQAEPGPSPDRFSTTCTTAVRNPSATPFCLCFAAIIARRRSRAFIYSPLSSPLHEGERKQTACAHRAPRPSGNVEQPHVSANCLLSNHGSIFMPFLRKMDALILRRFPPKILIRSVFEISASKTLPSSVA